MIANAKKIRKSPHRTSCNGAGVGKNVPEGIGEYAGHGWRKSAETQAATVTRIELYHSTCSWSSEQ